MNIVPTSWELASLFCKLFFYFGAASMIGGSVCLWLYNDGSRRVVQANIRYLTFGAFIGFQGALLNFLVQVGMVSGSGVMGMFDWNMASIFLDTQLGDTTFLGWLASLLFLLLVCSICKR